MLRLNAAAGLLWLLNTISSAFYGDTSLREQAFPLIDDAVSFHTGRSGDRGSDGLRRLSFGSIGIFSQLSDPIPRRLNRRRHGKEWIGFSPYRLPGMGRL
jgi:hypothetical protein